MKSYIRNNFPFFLFLVLCAFFFWPLAFMQDTLKWDALDAFLPWRRAVTESLRSFHLPSWNVYQYLGFPLHSDPECGAWYPIVWILALFRSYDFYSQNIEFCFHIFIAGYGTFLLCKSLGQHILAALLAGICFMGCGFFVGNAQNFIFLIGVAWFPWALYYLRQALTTQSRKAALKTGLALFMILSGSYPGISIIALYGLLGYVIYYIITRYPKKQALDFLMQHSRIGLWVLVSSIAFSSVVIVSVYEALPYFSRSSAISYKLISENPFSPKAFISLLLPFATSGLEGYDWGSGNCMINAYIGIIPLLLIADWFVSKEKKKKEWVLLIAAMLLMGIAMGDYLPLRYWLFRFVPGMNLFRHPAIFRAFALLALLLLAGFHFSCLLNKGGNLLKSLKRIIGIALAFFIGILIWTCPVDPLLVLRVFGLTYYHPLSSIHLKVSEHIFIQSLLQVIVLSITLLVFWRAKKPLHLLPYMVILDIFLAIQLNMSSTVTYAESVNTFARREEQLLNVAREINGYNNHLISDNEPGKLGARVEGLWRNLNMLCKQPYYEGYNSFQFSSFNRYELSHFFYTGMKNRILYLSDTCYSISNMEDSLAVLYHPTNLYAKEIIDHRMEISRSYRVHSPVDTVKGIVINENEIKASVNLRKKGILTLLQNYHRNWKVTIDKIDRSRDLFVTNHTLISIVLERGNHEVKFWYYPWKSYMAFYISLVSISLSCLLLVIYSKEKRPHREV
jgi:hypothetical protein